MNMEVIIMIHFWLGLLLFVDGVVMAFAGVIAGSYDGDMSSAVLVIIGAIAMIVGVAVGIAGYIKKRK